jgi:hypothetical protein
MATSAAPAYGRRLNEQARRLNVSPATIHRMLRRGLRGTLVGGYWHIRDSDLDVYLAERTAARLRQPAPASTGTNTDAELSRRADEANRQLESVGW